MFELGIDDIDQRHPALSAQSGHDKMLGQQAQRNGNAHVRLYAAIRMPLDAVRSHCAYPDRRCGASDVAVWR
ncbi:MAG: hypothetical protein RLZZ237_1835 [Pseudomonadota bacterium]|jgi:hypothetical protein